MTDAGAEALATFVAREPKFTVGLRVRRVQLGWTGTIRKVIPAKGWECYTFVTVDWDPPRMPRRSKLWAGDLEALTA